MEASAPIHLSLNSLKAVDLSFSPAVAPVGSHRRDDRVEVLLQAVRESNQRPDAGLRCGANQCSMPSVSCVAMASRKSSARNRIDRMIGQFTATCSNKIRCSSDRRSVGLHVRMAACLGAMRSSLRFFDEEPDRGLARQEET